MGYVWVTSWQSSKCVLPLGMHPIGKLKEFKSTLLMSSDLHRYAGWWGEVFSWDVRLHNRPIRPCLSCRTVAGVEKEISSPVGFGRHSLRTWSSNDDIAVADRPVRHSDVTVGVGETLDDKMTSKNNHGSPMNERVSSAWRTLCGGIMLCSHQELSGLLSRHSSYHFGTRQR